MAKPQIELRRDGRVEKLPPGFAHFTGGAL
jgi:hypothetical protein